MRIAQIAPLIESVPPALYGGTERVVSVLTEELVRRGHDVTLFASGDSTTTAKLVTCASRSLRLDPQVKDYVARTMVELSTVFQREDDFDVIHNHVDYYAFPFARFARKPMLTTAHGRLDLAETLDVYRYFSETPLVSISESQREPLSEANWLSTVYNGVDFSSYEFHPGPGKYLAFLGRISPEKRVDRAIEVARSLNMPLKIAAKVDDIDRAYFEHAIRPYLGTSLVDYVGEISEEEKDEFLGEAFAYLFPIDWPEPFGLTMVEAMACGTPVVAMDVGSVPEVVKHGVSGFVCSSIRDFVDSVAGANTIDRKACREYALSHFSAQLMADGYEAVYKTLLSSKDSREAGLVLPAFV